MVYSDPWLEKRRGNVSTPTSGKVAIPKSTGGFIDPVLEARRKLDVSKQKTNSFPISTPSVAEPTPVKPPNLIEKAVSAVKGFFTPAGGKPQPIEPLIDLSKPTQMINAENVGKIDLGSLNVGDKVPGFKIEKKINTVDKLFMPSEFDFGSKQPTSAQLKPEVQGKVGSTIVDQFKKNFPESTKAIESVSQSIPLKEMFPKTWETIKTTYQDSYTRALMTHEPSKTTSEKISKELRNLSGMANQFFVTAGSPLVLASNMPVAGNLVRAFMVPFITLGEAAPKVSDQMIDEMPIDDKAKENLKPAVGEVLTLVAQVALGSYLGAIAGQYTRKTTPKVLEALTKDVITNYNLPKTVSIPAEKIWKELTTGNSLNPEEKQFLKDAGLDGPGYHKAAKNGLTLDIPAEKIVTMVDKPYWAKIKSLLKQPAGEPKIVTETLNNTKPSPRLKQIEAGSKIEFDPESANRIVIKDGLENTDLGKKIMKTSVEATNNGQQIAIVLMPPGTKIGPNTVLTPDGKLVEVTATTPETPVAPEAPAPVEPTAPTAPVQRQVIKLDKPEGVKTASVVVRGETASMTIQINPDARGKGLGTQMVKLGEKKALEAGAKRMEVAASDKAVGDQWDNSVGFWEKMDYTKVPGAISKNGTIQMEKILLPSNAKTGTKISSNIRKDAIDGKLESRRLNTQENISQVNIPGLDNPTPESTVKVYRAGTGNLKAGDFVTTRLDVADKYVSDRKGTKLYQNDVALNDLLIHIKGKGEFIYAPKTAIETQKEPIVAKITPPEPQKPQKKEEKVVVEPKTVEPTAAESQIMEAIMSGDMEAAKNLHKTLSEQGKVADLADLEAQVSEYQKSVVDGVISEVEMDNLDPESPDAQLLELARRMGKQIKAPGAIMRFTGAKRTYTDSKGRTITVGGTALETFDTLFFSNDIVGFAKNMEIMADLWDKSFSELSATIKSGAIDGGDYEKFTEGFRKELDKRPTYSKGSGPANKASSKVETPKPSKEATERVSSSTSDVKVYRASKEVFDPKKITEDGLAVTTNKVVADRYSENGNRKVEELTILRGAKILSFEDTPKELYVKDGSDYIPKDNGDGIEIAKYAKKNGYDAVKMWGVDEEIRVVNPDIIEAQTNMFGVTGEGSIDQSTKTRLAQQKIEEARAKLAARLFGNEPGFEGTPLGSSVETPMEKAARGGGQGGGTMASKGTYIEEPTRTKPSGPTAKDAETPGIIEFPEMVRIVKELTGVVPSVRKLRSANGNFNPITQEIKLNAAMFSNPKQAARTLAHEIGHLTDFLAETGNTMKRGNLLGRLASLAGYRKHFISDKPPAESDLITPEVRKALEKLAHKLASEPVEVTKQVEIGTSSVTPEEVLAIWKDNTAGLKNPELMKYIQTLSSADKVSIAKAALKGLIPEWVKYVKKEIKTITVKEIRRSPADIRALYKKLLKEEIERRHLVSQDVIKKELKMLSHTWRPVNPAGGPGYMAYRNSGVELYADAISVLFNDPIRLQEDAPVFYRTFFNYLGNKPEAGKAFYEAWDLLHQGVDAVNDQRLADIYKGFEEAKQKRIDIEKKVETPKPWIERFMRNHVTKFDPIYRKLKGKPGSQVVRQALEDMQMRRNDQAVFLDRVVLDITDPLLAIGMTENDLGYVLKAERESLGDRIDMANPGGAIGEVPKTNLEKFYKDRNLTPEQKRVFDEIKKKFHEMIFDEVQRAVDNGNYNKEIFKEKIEPNKYTYATFGVIDYIDKNYISAGIKKQIGTVKDIENPYISSMLKTISLIEWNNMQEAKTTIIKELQTYFPDDVKLAEPIKTTDGTVIKFKREDGMEAIEVREDGKPVAYNVDPYIKSMFDNKTITANEMHILVKMSRDFNSIFKPLVTTFNVSWGFYSNIVRDTKRTYISLGSALNKFAPGEKGLTIGEMLKTWVSSIPEGAKFAKDQRTELIREMMSNKALGTAWSEYDPKANNDTSIAFLLRKYNLLGKAAPATLLRKIWVNSMGALLDKIKIAGATFEATSKISGYRIAKRRITDPKLLGFITRNYVGTPNYYDGGAQKQVDNNVFVFSNIMLQANRIAVELATDPKTRGGWWTRTFVVEVLPTLIMLAGAAGYFGEKVKDNYAKQTEYDKTNYQTIPIGLDKNGEAIYFRLPKDESGRFMSAVVWKAGMGIVNGEIRNPEQVLAVGAGVLPSTTPLWTFLGDWMQYFQGRNPYDSYRGRLAIDETTWNAGGLDRFGKMVKYSMNTIGLGGFSTYDSGNDSLIKKVLSNIPVINRAIKVSNYGLQEANQSAANEAIQEEAKQRLENRKIIDEAVKEVGDGTDKMDALIKMTQKITDKGPVTPDTLKQIKSAQNGFKLAIIKGNNDPNINSLIYATSNNQKVSILKNIKDTSTEKEYKDILMSAVVNGIISEDVVIKSMDLQK